MPALLFIWRYWQIILAFGIMAAFAYVYFLGGQAAKEDIEYKTIKKEAQFNSQFRKEVERVESQRPSDRTALINRLRTQGL